MTVPTQPTRVLSSSPKCNRPQAGDGIMSFPCTLPQGHEADTTDPSDEQPCYAVESGRTVRMWGAWSTREATRKHLLTQPIGDVRIDCPACQTSGAMKVTSTGGLCEECGAEAEIQSDQPAPEDDPEDAIGRVASVPDAEVIEALTPYIDPNSEPPVEAAFSRVTVPVEEVESVHHDLEPFETGERDADIIAAATEAGRRLAFEAIAEDAIAAGLPDAWFTAGQATTYPTDGCNAEHSPDSNPNCVMAPAAEPLVIPFDPQPGDYIPSPEEVAAWIDQNNGLRTREGDQRLPDGDLNISDDQLLVIRDIEERRRVGIQRYGQGHRPFNGRNTLQDAYEENLDWLVYMRSLLRTREADRDVLVKVAADALRKAEDSLDGDTSFADLAYSDIAEVVVDRLLDWHMAQRTLKTDGVTDKIREALKYGLHRITDDGDTLVSMSYVLGALEQIDKQNEENN